jgi:hypothetical protein
MIIIKIPTSVPKFSTQAEPERKKKNIKRTKLKITLIKKFMNG